jgi:hypothetical protein
MMVYPQNTGAILLPADGVGLAPTDDALAKGLRRLLVGFASVSCAR